MPRNKSATTVLDARGSFKHRPGRRPELPEPVHEGPIGSPPDYLSKVQAKIWFELCECAPPGVLSAAERPILADYCRLEAILRQYEIESASYTGVGKPPKPPGATVYSAKRNILGAFGMTPGDRNRVGVAAPKDASEFDDL